MSENAQRSRPIIETLYVSSLKEGLTEARKIEGVVRRAAKSLGLNDDIADDTVQDTWLATLIRQKAIEDDRKEAIINEAAWIASVGRNISVSAYRFAKKRDHVNIDTIDVPDDRSRRYERAIEQARQEADLYEAIASLPNEDRDLLVFCQLEGHTYAETAAHFGLTDGALRARLRRAKKTLREKLKASNSPE